MGKKASPRSPATIGHMAKIENHINEDLSRKSARLLSEYHEMFVGTSPTGPTVDQRLWLAERANPIWWVAATVLWIVDQVRRLLKPKKKAPAEPCNHTVDELAISKNEPQIPCPNCGLGLLLKVDNGV